MGAEAAGEKAAAERDERAAMEAEIEKAMLARVQDFKKKADSLTLEGVRRALEDELELEIFSLDAHKKFIKQCVDKVFSGSDDENTTNDTSEKADGKDDQSVKEGLEDAQPTSGSNIYSSGANEKQERSSETEKDPEGGKIQASGSDISEDMIKEAIGRRASYFRENSETLNLLGVRRTLEEDLKLEKKALDTYKSFITRELDNVLQQPANGTKKNSKKVSRKDVQQKTSKGSKRSRQDSDTSEINDSYSEREASDEDTRPKKRGVERGKAMKRQKKAAEEKKQSTPKAKKVSKRDLDKSSEVQGGNSSSEDHSHSSAEEDNKKKRQPTPAYGKQVEHLKLIIKSCGMSIPPSVYRRAKQAPDSKREASLLKELEEILEKEGLSKNPSEKEIKAVKKRKERAKELEGIDMSNIITSSRRRAASSYLPPPMPKMEAESDDDDDEDDEEDEQDDENGEDGAEGDNDGAGDGSADDAEDESD